MLIGDPYTIEYFPGLYTHGVVKVAEEVAKGTAEIILLMPWPGKGSESTLDHYKEVVYRTGRTGGFKVAPAGLAWKAVGKKAVGNTHPSKDGAYVAAASIFSRIWKKSASTSSYSYKDSLANVVHKTVTSNVGAKQYSGRFDFQNPCRMFGNHARIVTPRKSSGGTSTESDLVGRSKDALARCNVLYGPKGPGYTIGRASGNPKGRKDYRNKGDGPAFGFVYQFEPNEPDAHLANILPWDINLANSMRTGSKQHRALFRRLHVGSLLQYNPKMRIKYGTHAYGPQSIAMATYMYTLYSGRCPMTAKPVPVEGKPGQGEENWNGQKVGYEAAWHMATCQSRAPGFKIMPSSKERMTVDAEYPEKMTVQFLMKPQKPVTVTVKTDNDKVATVSPQRLTFTSDNHATVQTVTVSVKAGVPPGTEFTVSYVIRSGDEVFDDLSDSWKYHVNAHPEADDQTVVAPEGRVTAINLTGSDADKEVLTYSLVNKPTNGTVTISPVGVAAYTPNTGYAGTDEFTFRSFDRSVYSKPATVTITVQKTALYGTNLLHDGNGELAPFTTYKWVQVSGTWTQRTGAREGTYLFAPKGKTAELTQTVDLKRYAGTIKADKQSFEISGFIDNRKADAKAIAEFLDSAGNVLLSCDLKRTSEKSKSGSPLKLFKCSKRAPVDSAGIRLRLTSIRTRGRENAGRFDGLKIVALDPTKPLPVEANRQQKPQK